MPLRVKQIVFLKANVQLLKPAYIIFVLQSLNMIALLRAAIFESAYFSLWQANFSHFCALIQAWWNFPWRHFLNHSLWFQLPEAPLSDHSKAKFMSTRNWRGIGSGLSISHQIFIKAGFPWNKVKFNQPSSVETLKSFQVQCP